MRPAKILLCLLSMGSAIFAQPATIPDEIPALIAPPTAPPAIGETSRPDYPRVTPYDPSRVYLPEPGSVVEVPQTQAAKLGWFEASLLLVGSDRGSLPPAFDGTDAKNGHPVAGLRLDAGLWLYRPLGWSLEGSLLYLEPRSDIVRVREGTRNGFLEARSDFFTAELLTSFRGSYSEALRIDPVFGYRYARLSEGLTGGYEDFDATTSTRATVLGRQTFRNQFHGFDTGLSSEYLRDRWSLGVAAKVAFGATFATRVISAAGRIDRGSRSDVGFGSLKASSTGFAFVPDVNVDLGYRVTDWWRVDVGYQFLYLSRAIRPGSYADEMSFRGFALHGLRLGTELRF